MASCAMNHQAGQHSLTCDFVTKANHHEKAVRTNAVSKRNARNKANKAALTRYNQECISAGGKKQVAFPERGIVN